MLVRDLRLLSDTTEATQIKVGAPFTRRRDPFQRRPASAPPLIIRAAFLASARNPGDARHRDLDSIGWSQPGALPQPGSTAPASPAIAPAGAVPGAPARTVLPASQSGALLLLAQRGRPRILYIEGENAAKSYFSAAGADPREHRGRDARAHGLPSRAPWICWALICCSCPMCRATLVTPSADASTSRATSATLAAASPWPVARTALASGGYQGTQLEKVPPARFEQEARDQPTLALILAIDRSARCERSQTRARQGCRPRHSRDAAGR